MRTYRPLFEVSHGFHRRGIGSTRGIKKLIRPLLKLFFILLIIGTISFAGAYVWFSRELPKSTDLLTKQKAPSTKIYDRTGQILLNDVSSDFKRIKISLNELPEYVKWTTIVSEDKQFYSHHGLNFRGILRAIFINLITGSTTAQGGSSISQQFIKNAVLSPEKTYTRKIKEAIMAWQLERRFSKDQILEMYFNEIPYGGTVYGIEAATQKYFGKHAKELTLAEAAALAALPQAPSYYSPYGSNKDKLLKRKDWILDALAEEGYVKKEVADAAKKQPLEFTQSPSSIIAPHFVFYVREQIAAQYGEKMLAEGGLKVITTLDMNQQKIAEEAIKNQVEKNIQRNAGNNAALVALNPKTGEITALVGSANYFDEKIDGAVNVALSPRQPGSSFKPVVYATAFSRGYSPETILFDVLTKFKTQPEDYEPHNYGDKYHGPVSIRQALAGSLNVPAVKTIYLVGVENVLNQAEKMGYTTFGDRSRFGLSLVLGGGEVKLLEHTAGYATLASEGIYRAPFAILKVEDKNGKVLEENQPEKNKGKQVIETQIARQITDILFDNNARAFVFGSQNYLVLPNRSVAAKTGTTNDYKDAWTLGYTPSLVAGVWAGNTRGEPMKGAADGSAVAAPIWQEFMKKVLADSPAEDFIKPEPITLPDKPMMNGKFVGEIRQKFDKRTGQLATDFTPPDQIEEKVFKEVHSILHYVNRNNPLGPIPEKPWEMDENYTTWETAVADWAQKNGYVNQVETVAPGSQTTPSVDLQKPTDGENLYEEKFPYAVEVKVSNNTGQFKKIDFYLRDSQGKDTWLGYKNVEGWQNNFVWQEPPAPGSYTLSIVVSDQNNNVVFRDEAKVEMK